MNSGRPSHLMLCLILVLAVSIIFLAGCGGGTAASGSTAPQTSALTVAVTGTGTVASSPSGISCGPTCTATFTNGTQVTLTATAGTGFTFTGWGGACSGSAACSVTVSAATSVTATFTANPTLQVMISPTGGGTVTSTPAGINCPTTCSSTNFANNTQVTLTASASNGYAFTGWSGGACSGTSACAITITAATSVTANFNAVPSSTVAVTSSGYGSGTVTSTPSGINCPTVCSATFADGGSVTLTATPGTNFSFAGWSGGGCSGTTTSCVVAVNAATTVNAKFGGTLQSLNHIILFAQENRSFDHYFGALAQYWADDGYVHYANQPFDGLPQFPLSAPSGPPATNPGCDPSQPWSVNTPVDCAWDPAAPVTSYHLQSMCVENPSPSWNESHVAMNYNDPTLIYTGKATLDGFVWAAGHDSRAPIYDQNGNIIASQFMDTNGLRVMGHYDGDDLNYYYFMASNFATSDRWFSPAMSRTQINRMYLLAATSQGHAYPLHGNDQQLTAPPIFEALQNAGISWKIYIHPNPKAATTSNGTNCPAFSTTPLCLYQVSYLNMFMYGDTVINDPVLSQNLVPVSQFAIDAANGTLPQVALIEPASASGLDEHPADFDPTLADPTPCCSVQAGAAYAEGVIDSLINSPSWKDSALLFTYDEFGGFYDHVSPQPTVSPDGIKPDDLLPDDVCTRLTGPTCDFVYTGYRVPFVAISPFSKKNYVSHSVMDYTAWLKLVETRFGLQPLTARDAAQPDMSAEFFDFVNAPWLTPPSATKTAMQHTGGVCDLSPPDTTGGP